MRAIHGGKTKNDGIDSYKIALLLKAGIASPYPQYQQPIQLARVQ
jgi:hypothetical protein